MALTRRKEREIAFQMLFAAQFSKEENPEELYQTLVEECEEPEAKDSDYIRKVFCGAVAFAPQADLLIEQNAKDWDLNRLSKTTRAILHLAIFEMQKVDEVPEKIAINEAVEIAKRFGEEKSSRFINGILGAVAVN